MSDDDALSRAGAAMGKKGGKKAFQLFGRSYYSEIGRRGGLKRWQGHPSKSKTQQDVVQVNEDQVVNVNTG